MDMKSRRHFTRFDRQTRLSLTGFARGNENSDNANSLKIFWPKRNDMVNENIFNNKKKMKAKSWCSLCTDRKRQDEASVLLKGFFFQPEEISLSHISILKNIFGIYYLPLVFYFPDHKAREARESSPLGLVSACTKDSDTDIWSRTHTYGVDLSKVISLYEKSGHHQHSTQNAIFTR